MKEITPIVYSPNVKIGISYCKFSINNHDYSNVILISCTGVKQYY